MRTWVITAGILAALAAPAAGHTVNTDNLNVRSGPGTTYSIVGTLTRGTMVNVVGTSGTWSKIDGPKTGWVSTQYLTASSHSATVNASSVNVRSGPGTGYSIVGTLSNGTMVTRAYTSGDWTKITSPKTGWVSSQYLSVGGTSTGTSDFIWPMTGQLIGVWDSQRASGPHHAIDIGDKIGIPIYAARGGTLSRRDNPTGYGYYVSVTHEAGYRTVYAHLSAYVAPNGAVAKGQYIAKCGDSGNAKGTQPHVHWEIWRYDAKVYMPGTVWSRVTAKTAYPYNYSGI